MPSIMYVLVHAHIFQWESSQLCLFLFLLFSTPLKTFRGRCSTKLKGRCISNSVHLSPLQIASMLKSYALMLSPPSPPPYRHCSRGYERCVSAALLVLPPGCEGELWHGQQCHPIPWHRPRHCPVTEGTHAHSPISVTSVHGHHSFTSPWDKMICCVIYRLTCRTVSPTSCLK